MSEENKTPEEHLPALVKAAPELLPVWDWWVKEGKSTVTMLLVAAVVVAGFYGGRNWLRGRDAAATEGLEDEVAEAAEAAEAAEVAEVAEAAEAIEAAGVAEAVDAVAAAGTAEATEAAEAVSAAGVAESTESLKPAED